MVPEIFIGDIGPQIKTQGRRDERSGVGQRKLLLSFEFARAGLGRFNVQTVEFRGIKADFLGKIPKKPSGLYRAAPGQGIIFVVEINRSGHFVLREFLPLQDRLDFRHKSH
jgi:hypothetical protein